MIASLRALAGLAGMRRFAALAALTALGAATEGIGLVMLVPLVASLTGEGAIPALGMALPQWPLAMLLTVFVGLVVLRAAVEMARSLAAQDLEVAVVDGLRGRAVAALLGAEWRTLATMHQSANRALLITAVDRVGLAVHHLVTLLRTSVSLAALAIAGLALAPLPVIAGALAGLLAIALLRPLRGRARQIGEELSRHYEAIYLRLEQSLSALRLIKSFGREEDERTELDRRFAALRRSERRYILATTIARGALQAGAALALAVLVWFAVTRWEVALAILLALVALASRAVPLAEALRAAAQGWAHAAPALDDACRLIDEAQAAAEAAPAPAAPRLARALTLERVSFRHAPGRVGLQDVSFVIPAGRITALTGPSGSGKSTLADLVGGLLSPDSGRVLVDGTALDGGIRNAWRHRVAYVQQDAVLFSGSIRDNLLWALPSADGPQLEAGLAAAAAGFVATLPGGLDCAIGEGGRALSGGERQRIALARALLRAPDLLILDEATSALDSDSERAIVAAVRALAGRCTVLVIGHRGALVAAADQSFALARGRLVSG